MAWITRNIPTTNWNSTRTPAFLLTEAFEFLLQEDGGKIQLQETGLPSTQWISRTIPS